MPRAEVGAAAARATDVEAARHVMCRAAFHFVADFRRDAHQVELCGLCIARAKGEAHARHDQLGDRQDLVLPVHAHQVPHGGFRAELSGPRRHVHGCGDQAHQRAGQRLRHLVIRRIPAEPQILQHAIERGLAVQGDGEISLGCGDFAHRSDRLTALSHARDEAHFGAEGHSG